MVSISEECFRRETAGAIHMRGKQSIRQPIGCNDPGDCPDPLKYENWQIKMICQLIYMVISVKDNTLSAGGFLCIIEKRHCPQDNAS